MYHPIVLQPPIQFFWDLYLCNKYSEFTFLLTKIHIHFLYAVPSNKSRHWTQLLVDHQISRSNHQLRWLNVIITTFPSNNPIIGNYTAIGRNGIPIGLAYSFVTIVYRLENVPFSSWYPLVGERSKTFADSSGGCWKSFICYFFQSKVYRAIGYW